MIAGRAVPWERWRPAGGLSLEGVSKWLTTTSMAPGIEITWLPSVVPTGHGKNEIAVPEGTSVGSQAISIPGGAGVAGAPFEVPSQPSSSPGVSPWPPQGQLYRRNSELQ